jgi:hypothetical protein
VATTPQLTPNFQAVLETVLGINIILARCDLQGRAFKIGYLIDGSHPLIPCSIRRRYWCCMKITISYQTIFLSRRRHPRLIAFAC